MTPKLYTTERSPPCRAVLILAKALGLQLNEINVEILNGDHMTPEFLKMNPQHTIPTFVDDDGTTLWDSHAIMPYLVAKYGKSDSLYPEDPVKRAVIDQRLHFDSGIVWQTTLKLVYSIIRDKITEIPQQTTDAAGEIYALLEKFLETNRWIAGNEVTLADISVYTSSQCLSVFIPIDSAKYPKVAAWFKRIEAVPFFEANKSGHEAFRKFISQFFKI